MSRKKLSTTVYITPQQDETLKRLSAATRVPVAELIRQGIDLTHGALRDLGGIRIFLCGDCFRYCVKMSKARVTA